MVINIKQYGASADGVRNDTIFFQKAVDEISANGGGELIVPRGDYVLATLFLRNNVSIRLDEGARLLGTLTFSEYEKDEKVDYPLYQDASHSFFHCSMFVGINVENIKIYGGGLIDMRSVWDEENVRNMVHRGAKAMALKYCKNVFIDNIGVYNATDLAIYFAGCEDVEISRIKMRTHIDGISPDNCKNVKIHDCDIESGDDGIVLKSSYTLNKLDICKNIYVWNCNVKSACNSIKFGTETNGGFEDVIIKDMRVFDTKLAGIAVESVDGAVINNLTFENISMQNVASPLFVYIGKRMRGPKELKLGSISNIFFRNITASGEYKEFDCVEGSYSGFVEKKTRRMHWTIEQKELLPNCAWQVTSGMYGLQESVLKNIYLENVYLKMYGACKQEPLGLETPTRVYPEVYVYGRLLPAKGICFRDIDGLTLKNVKVETYYDDVRQDFKFYNVNNLKIE